MNYLILSLRYSKGDNLVWWRPNNAGYTVVLESAGRYTQEQIDECPNYYNDGDNTLAVPESSALGAAVSVVSNSSNTIAGFKAHHLSSPAPSKAEVGQ